MKNAYEIVEELLQQGKYYITWAELRDYDEKEIILAILKSKYNAKLVDTYSSGYKFDNPYRQKIYYYKLEYCFLNKNEWESCSMIPCESDNKESICREIIRLDSSDEKLCWDKNKNKELVEKEKVLFEKIMKYKIYVGIQRYWRIKVVLDY